MDHLRTLWSGGLAGYAVIATAQDTTAQPRKIQSYDNENVRAIVSLVAHPDGSIWAEIGDDVPVKRLKKHAANHGLLPGEGAFPIARVPSKVFKASSAAYLATSLNRAMLRRRLCSEAVIDLRAAAQLTSSSSTHPNGDSRLTSARAKLAFATSSSGLRPWT